MKRGQIIGLIGMTIAVVTVVLWWLMKDATLHVLQPTGAIAQQQASLVVLTILLSLFVVIPVFTMLIAFAWKYSDKNKKLATYTPEWHANTTLEVIWWGIPIVIIGILAIVTWFTSHSLDPYRSLDSSQKPLEVQVVALQWKWLFLYPEQGVATVNVLPISKDRPVHFTISADSPMSAFWIPTLGTQIYSMNGMSSQLNLVANREGTYYGYNTNINGRGYADMRFSVHVYSKSEFDTVIAKATESAFEMDEQTYQVISQPAVERRELYYKFSDKDLFNQVVMKYMHGTMPAENISTNHSIHTMEGM